jgi:hypothetical protein
MSISRDFIPIINSGDELKRKSVPTKIIQQTPADCISELFYIIDRSEGDVVEPGARQRQAGYYAGHCRRDHCAGQNNQAR